MDLKIRTTVEGKEATVIRDGSIIVEYGSCIWVDIEDLKFKFKFENYKEGEKLIKASVGADNEDSECMEILIRVNESSVDSVFLSPVNIGSFTKEEKTYAFGLSFAVKKLSGSSNNCLQFTYTFFLS